jgi:hypothetical protein
MVMGEFNDGTDVDKWLFDHIKSIKGSNVSVQVILYQTNSLFLPIKPKYYDIFSHYFLPKR